VNKAIDFYKEAMKLDPDASYIGEELAELYVQTQQLERATTQANDLIKANPNNAGPHKILARIYARQIGDPDQGKVDQAMLKSAITEMNIYSPDAELKLDERELSTRLGISRTPLREALAQLEQEGLVRIAPRKGIFIVRKTKAEILDMITVWAALESMSARLATKEASDEAISGLHSLVDQFSQDELAQRMGEYSDANIRFHQAIVSLAKNKLLTDTMENLFIHMRSIRRRTISERDRAARSIIDHMNIIEALERRDTMRAEELVRQHSLDLATHVEKNVNYLD